MIGGHMGDGSVELKAAAECRCNHVVQARRRDRGVGTVEGAGVCGETDVVVGPARDDERSLRAIAWQSINALDCRAGLAMTGVFKLTDKLAKK